MKIIYCIAGTFNSGGMERIVTAKANWLAANGFEVIIITTEQQGRNNFFHLDNKVRRIDLQVGYSDTDGLNPIKKYFARKQRINIHKNGIKRIIDIEKPDVIISTFGNEVNFIPKIAGTAATIAEIHFSRWFRLQLNRKGLWKIIDKYLTWQDKITLSRYDAFVTLTEEDRKNWGNQQNLHVIPNFINSKATKPATLESKTIIAVGRLSYQKGYDRMIDAWSIVSSKHQDWKLKIFGAGELKEELLEKISSLGLMNQITIIDPVNTIEEEYVKSSALLLSSHYEGLPMVLLEAMSAGVPPIAFTCQCGPKDLINDSVNGLLVEEGAIDGFAKAILKIINDDKFRKELGKNAYETANNYLINPIMNKWVNLFKSLNY